MIRRLLSCEEATGKAVAESKRYHALLNTLGATALLGIEMILTRLAYEQLAVLGDADPLGV